VNIFKIKSKPLSGTNYAEVYPQGLALYKLIASKTKRQPYVRSVYFDKEKVFLDYFWQHIREKNLRDKTRRLKYYPCALELIQYSHVQPISKVNPNKRSEILHRFSGTTTHGEIFFVQIKEDLKKGQKHFISVFPA
jgi:hypothetical protein